MKNIKPLITIMLCLAVLLGLIVSSAPKVASAGPPNLNNSTTVCLPTAAASGALICSAYGATGASPALASTSQRIVLKHATIFASAAATVRITDGSSASSGTSPTLAVIVFGAAGSFTLTGTALGVSADGTGGVKTTAGNGLYAQTDGTSCNVSAICVINVE